MKKGIFLIFLFINIIIFANNNIYCPEYFTCPENGCNYFKRDNFIAHEKYLPPGTYDFIGANVEANFTGRAANCIYYNRKPFSNEVYSASLYYTIPLEADLKMDNNNWKKQNFPDPNILICEVNPSHCPFKLISS